MKYPQGPTWYRRPRIQQVLSFILLWLLGPYVLLAQSGAGTIQGTVTDETGAVIPNAPVHVENTETGVATDTKANDAGFYRVPELFTGHYTVTVTAPGMKMYTTSIDLLVAQNAVINPILLVGSESQQTMVSANAVQLLTTDSGTITSTLENARIDQLPENGRYLTSLLSTVVPGLENGGKDVNGLLPSALIYEVDGVTTQDDLRGGLFYGSGGSQLIDPDAVQEVRAVVSNAGAEYATPATVVITTKSGTDAIHGTFFETARNNAFGVAKSRQNPSNFSAPHLVRNEFGLSAGGPIVLPHIYNGKNRSFWFLAYERYSLAQSVSSLTSVPTAAMRSGNFSGLINGNGVLQTIFDPSTTSATTNCAYLTTLNKKVTASNFCRVPFMNNQIPVAEESPLAKVAYSLIPLPTNNANPLVTPNYTSQTPEISIEPQLTFRLDHVFNQNDRAYLRYTQNLQGTNITSGPQNVDADGIPAGAAVSQTGYLNNPTNGYFAGLGYTHIFSSTLVAETILSQQWFSERKFPGAAALTPNVNYESMLNLPNNFGATGFPQIGNGSLIFSLGSSQTNTAGESQIISTLDENLTKTLGRHVLLFGGRFSHERLAAVPNQPADSVAFGPAPTSIYNPATGVNYNGAVNTGDAEASLFLGSATNYTVFQVGGPAHFHTNELDAYVQDNFHLNQKLTLNFGLRYEAHPAIWTKGGVNTGFDLKNDAEILSAPISTLIAEGRTTQAIITNDENIGVKFETPQEAGLPSTLIRNYNLNFLPRVAFAYQPIQGTVLRGGYGIFANSMPIEDFVGYSTTAQNPFTVPFSQSYATAAQAIDGLPNETIRYNAPAVFGVAGENTAGVINTNSTNGILPGIVKQSASPDSPPQFVTEANFTFEQSLKGNSALRVSWVFTHAKNLAVADNYNYPLTGFQWELATGTTPPNGGYSVIGTPLQNTYSSTALGPYNQTTWGNSDIVSRTGWSNDNMAQVTYQRLFHHGSAYQINYVFSRAFRVGGDNTGTVPPAEYPYADFPGARGSAGVLSTPYGPVFPGVRPPTVPAGQPTWADYHAMLRYQGYQLDNTVPVHHITFNGIYDLPFGRDKRFFGNVNRFVNELIGGFQIAGQGNVLSQLFQTSQIYWGPTSPLHVYKHRYPTMDCRSGVCEKSYLWYNGYLGPTVTTGVAGSVCTANCVSGLPSSYVPVQVPVDNIPGSPYYGTNAVAVTLANGSQTTNNYDAGPQGANYLAKKWINGPFNYTADLSVFKVFPIKGSMYLRFNVDAFNAFNVQGHNNPDATGLEHFLNSHNAPRQIQLTGRFTF